MAIVRNKDLKSMDVAALKEKLAEVEAALLEEIATLRTSRRSKTVKHKALRRARAKIKTILNQRSVNV